MADDFTDYQDAYDEAQQRAVRLGIDQAIRKVKWYGKVRFCVASASRNDSDYARAEIVTPTDPRVGRGKQRCKGRPEGRSDPA